MKGIVLGLLCVGFTQIFWGTEITSRMEALILRTKWGMEEAARQRALIGRKLLRVSARENNLWAVLEEQLYYAGLKLRYPGLTAEIWVVGHLVLMAGLAVVGGVFGGMDVFVTGVLLLGMLEVLVFGLLKARNLKRVNEQMMKLLDFLGNYSITSGEMTGIFFQVSRYMDFPIKNVLEECFYEAQTTGDAGLALLGMAEKIEHPKFKELACNMEISLRYCADFTALVAGSRRSLREYLKSARERKGMLREALISMILLLAMSMVILLAVSSLVQKDIAQLLFATLPGKIGIAVIGIIGLLFVGQLRKTHY